MIEGLRNSQKGFSLMELIVGLGVMSVVFSVTASSFFDTTSRAHRHELVTQAEEQARVIMDTLAYDVRMMGAGMPLGQNNFDMGDAALGDAPFPIFNNLDSDFAELRLNEKGVDTVITADFDPVVSLTFAVLSSTDFYDGDVVYLSDMVTGGENGLRGIIQSVSGNLITIAGDYIAPIGATFAEGSTVNRVTTVSYESLGFDIGIVRDNGISQVTLAPNTQFAFTYFDSSGVELVPPLSESQIENSLSGIRVLIEVQAPQPLEDGTTYVAQAEQLVALRNLNLNR